MTNPKRKLKLVKQEKSRVEEIAEDIAIKVIRAEYSKGMNLPTVRELAESYQAPVSTIQRVVVWLESKSLISVKQGSGIKVNDPRWADASLFPIWVKGLKDQPAEVVKILSDFLALRRELACELMLNIRPLLTDVHLARLEGMIEAFANEVQEENPDLNIIVDSDLSIVEYLIEIYDQRSFFQVFSVVRQSMESLPGLAESIYCKPETNVQGMRVMFQYLTDSDLSDQNFSKIVEQMLKTEDEKACKQLVQILSS